jgi:hypothetical protein
MVRVRVVGARKEESGVTLEGPKESTKKGGGVSGDRAIGKVKIGGLSETKGGNESAVKGDS